MVKRRTNESLEEWVRPCRARSQFGMSLGTNEKGVYTSRQLNELHETTIRRSSREDKSRLLELRPVGVRHLETVTMTLIDIGHAIRRCHEGSLEKFGRVQT